MINCFVYFLYLLVVASYMDGCHGDAGRRGHHEAAVPHGGHHVGRRLRHPHPRRQEVHRKLLHRRRRSQGRRRQGPREIQLRSRSVFCTRSREMVGRWSHVRNSVNQRKKGQTKKYCAFGVRRIQNTTLIVRSQSFR